MVLLGSKMVSKTPKTDPQIGDDEGDDDEDDDDDDDDDNEDRAGSSRTTRDMTLILA